MSSPPFERMPIDQAFHQLLLNERPEPWPIGLWEAPDEAYADPPATPYGVLYPLMGGGATDVDNLAGVEYMWVLTYQISSVGKRQDQASGFADAMRKIVLGNVPLPPVPGHTEDHRATVGAVGAPEESGGLFQAVDTYSLTITTI